MGEAHLQQLSRARTLGPRTGGSLRVQTLEKRKARTLPSAGPASLPWDLQPGEPWASDGERPGAPGDLGMCCPWDCGEFQEPLRASPLTESLFIFSAFRHRPTHTGKNQLITMHIL